jgi:TPR repeat protein
MFRVALVAIGVLASVTLSQAAAEPTRSRDECGLERAAIEDQTNRALEACAERGDADAMTRLGFLYWTAAAAERCEYTFSMMRGGPSSETCRLDDPAEFGFPSTMTLEALRAEGRRWVEGAAERGNAEAQNEIGLAYLVGDFGVPVDYAAARRWLEASVASGDEIGAYNLSRIYFGGLGVEASNARGEELLRIAAAGGYLAARCALAAWLTPDADAARRREAQAIRNGISREGEYCAPDMVMDEMRLNHFREAQ